MGWSLHTSHSRRPLEVEICWAEFSWFSLWGGIINLLHILLVNVSCSKLLVCCRCSQLISSCVYRLITIVSYFFCMNVEKGSSWKAIGLHLKVSETDTYIIPVQLIQFWCNNIYKIFSVWENMLEYLKRSSKYSVNSSLFPHVSFYFLID